MKNSTVFEGTVGFDIKNAKVTTPRRIIDVQSTFVWRKSPHLELVLSILHATFSVYVCKKRICALRDHFQSYALTDISSCSGHQYRFHLQASTNLKIVGEN